ncbi:hypothetical protein EZV62_028123 [Acer yangbiense]|uniref:Alpha/beta hydrolase fold-3 domain-containing protein n=1 Tax=Acer yangbiense TaxID=1000413 RepID=A0A5C7GNK1_9ROSI|nr:hypothetical protein EZV62_028123 [Acer yangbiense]
MESTKQEIDYEFLPRFRVYKDGHVERLMETDFVPAVSNDPITGVSSKDITIVQEPNNINISARLYLPKLTTTTTTQKFPLLIYFHGGAFCISSPFTSKNHNYVNALVAEANVVAVSVNYRKAPEHPIPAAYEDSWAALKWVASHSSNNGGGGGPESWLNHHADFERVFLAGDSAGANIAHNLAMAAGSGDSEFGLNVEILGIALVHPYFWGSDPIGSESLHPGSAEAGRLWPLICPSNPDNDDPRVNPVVAGGPSLVGLGCRRALVCVAENDVLKDRDTSGSWLSYFSDSFASLEVLNFANLSSEVDFDALERLVSRCKSLKVLKVNRSVSLEQLQKLLVLAPQLVELGTGSFSQEFSAHQFVELESCFSSCKNIQSLSGLCDATARYLPAIYPACAN